MILVVLPVVDEAGRLHWRVRLTNAPSGTLIRPVTFPQPRWRVLDAYVKVTP